MSQQSIQAEIDAQNARQSRIDALLETTPPHQLRRLEAERHQAALALARVFGHRLHAAVADRIVDGLILDPSTLCTIGGGVRELPNDARGWDARARAAAEKEPLAKLSIDHSDAALKEELRQIALNSLRPEQRLQMARSGTLDSYLEAEVKSKIEARAGV